MENLQTLGLRHAALYVEDPQRSKAFYMRVLRMKLEWEPDADNVYLTSEGQDNLALHREDRAQGLKSDPGSSQSAGPSPGSLGRLDHLGFALAELEQVDAWYEWVKSQGAPILREIKTHRDGARSFYFQDPDGVVIQMIYHPPIAARAKQGN
jgi:catechol 2,3-dioxygenase-like lactoylglutathione lyase family enzyme